MKRVTDRPQSDADQLRAAAAWLDTADKAFKTIADAQEVPPAQRPWEGDEVQRDLRRIAKKLERDERFYGVLGLVLTLAFIFTLAGHIRDRDWVMIVADSLLVVAMAGIAYSSLVGRRK